jgi:hypothetical protein
VDLLERHRTKRARGVPIISCFTGTIDRRLLGDVVEVMGHDVAELYAGFFTTRPLWRDVVTLVGKLVGRDDALVEQELAAKSAFDREILYRSLDLPDGAAQLIEAWLAGTEPPVLDLIRLQRIVPLAKWPLLLLPQPTDAALVALARLVEELPLLPAAAVVEEAQLDRLPPRVAALLREGLIRPWDPRRSEVEKRILEARDPLQAKSAAELFLFEVLEAMDDTRGLFVLNARQSFDFGPAPAEIDLACAERRLAIEIDGYFHFQDVDAYRRDRRKDVLLQAHGWLVLRFLALDVVPRLEEIIATIRRGLALRSGGDR